MEILESLFVILIVALLGMASRKTGIFSPRHIKVLSSFVYYFALPCLFYVGLARTDLASLDYQAALGSLLPIIGLLLGLFVLKLLRVMGRDNFILCSLAVCFGSNSFFGVAFFETFRGGSWLPLCIVMASLLGFTGIIYTLIYFEYAQNSKKGWGFFKKIVKNPLVISLFLGIFSSLTGIRPRFLNNALFMIGKTAGGVAIFSLGVFIYDNFSWGAVKKALAFSLFRFFALPLATCLIMFAFLTPPAGLREFLLLQSGIPAAISLAVFADRYGYKLPEVTGVVIITSALSFVGIPLLYLAAGLFN